MTRQFPRATVLGYPRIGAGRELKRAVEGYWSGKLAADQLTSTARALRATTRAHLIELGLGAADASIPLDFSLYDQMLDVACDVGAIPARFADLDTGGQMGLDGYFALARGDGSRMPLEMTKWFDSNYHYLVPEIGPATTLRVCGRRLTDLTLEAAADGVTGRPVMVGPVTFLALAKPAEGAPEGFHPLDRLDDLVACYLELAASLADVGAPWFQLDEPALVADLPGLPRADLAAAAARAYGRIAAATRRPGLFVTCPYGPADEAAGVLAGAGVEAIGLDLVKGTIPADADTGTLRTVTVVAGVIDGHNVWRTDLGEALDTAHRVAELAGDVAIATSTSLLHVPHDVGLETRLPADLAGWLAFADQKIGEVLTLARGLTEPDAIAPDLAASRDLLAARAAAPGVTDGYVRARLAHLNAKDENRAPFAERAAKQAARLDLPPLPTTTIGSFPQTPQIRAARAHLRAGSITDAEYREEMRAEIARVVELQESIGLDVLVHGEAERNDMVQYFAEQLQGFAATEHGWVQSYGTRCTRPPILWGDVERPAPMTLEWSSYAASLTAKPMKGMLTGPVTILAWSFVRDDQPRRDTALQVALALRDEIDDLQDAGLPIIQVDEPALRELLPLRAADRPDYLDWSVAAFRLATGSARPETQIHTHLCYSEFGDIIDAIDHLDADVTSIEAARSKMEVLADIARHGFARGIGPGVYDIHSPRVPTAQEITELLATAVRTLSPTQLWVNPDCGLKTRTYDEIVPALTHMVEATRYTRDGLT